jgi:hypothetical protein
MTDVASLIQMHDERFRFFYIACWPAQANTVALCAGDSQMKYAMRIDVTALISPRDETIGAAWAWLARGVTCLCPRGLGRRG